MTPDKTAERRDRRASSSEIGAIPECLNPKRRKSCRRNLEKFLMTYMPRSFYRPFSEDNRKAIKKIQKAILKGGTFAEALPRGSGKTTIAEGTATWAALYGHRQFIPIIGADLSHAVQILSDIKIEIETNDMMLEDFPEAAFPVRALEGRAQRCTSQQCDGVRTRIQWKTEEITFPTIPGSASSGTAMVAIGITGSIRGLKRKKVDGGDFRPDFVILDDPQTYESAENPKQCDKREKIIKGDILGLAGHDKSIAAIMPTTVIRKGDLADRFLDRKQHPEWQGHRTKLIYTWPDKHEDMWLGDYLTLWQEEQEESGTFDKATAYYEENREAMDAGAVIADDNLRDESEKSGLQHVYNTLFRVGDFAFYAEYQNDPQEAQPALYEITSEIVCSRVNNLTRLAMPTEAAWLVNFIDINYSDSGLHYVTAAFANDFTGWVVDYGRYPGDERRALWDPAKDAAITPAQAIWNGLNILVPSLFAMEYTKNGEPVSLDGMMIDCGFEMNTILRFVAEQRRANLPVMPSRGRPSTRYRLPSKIKLRGRPGDNHHVAVFAGGHGSAAVIHNAHYWRVHAQKAFLLSSGAPGSISLYGQADKPVNHKKFGKHIAAERLVEFQKGDVSDHYVWNQTPGQANDLLDCIVGCCVAGSKLGAERIIPEAGPAAKAGGSPGNPSAPTHSNGSRPRRKPRRAYSVDI